MFIKLTQHRDKWLERGHPSSNQKWSTLRWNTYRHILGQANLKYNEDSAYLSLFNNTNNTNLLSIRCSDEVLWVQNKRFTFSVKYTWDRPGHFIVFPV